MPSILIHGGRVIDPASGFDETADVLIADGKVREISAQPGRLKSSGDEVEQIDAEGCIVAPGLLDIHVHLREPSTTHRETIASGSAAAIAGGFTTVCCMPNTTPALDSAELVQFIAARAAAAGGARVFTIGAATRARQGRELADIARMAQAGAAGFSDDGDCVADPGMMREVLRAVAKAGSVFMQHCQDPAMTRSAAMNAGVLATRLGLIGWPTEAETSIIEQDVALNREISARYHAQHVSAAESVDALRAAQEDHQPVTGEVSPHHLLLTEEACARYDTNAKMNPPLRTRRDIDRLKLGVADGTISILATDHAPHLPEKKALEFAAAPFGIVGLDCALPLYAKALIEDGVLDWPAMLAMMTINPARLVGLDLMSLGMLKAGGPGDVTVIDPQLPWTIDVARFASAGRNCPFHGWQVKGRAAATIVSGKLLSTNVRQWQRVETTDEHG